MGRLFASDDAKGAASSARRDVQVFGPDDKFITSFGGDDYGPLGLSGNLQEPENFAIDELRDRIYVCDEGPNNIAVYRYSDFSFIQRIFGFISTPNGIDIDQYGYLYTVDQGNNNTSLVRVFEPEGLTQVFQFGGVSAESDLTPGLFNSPDTLFIHVERDTLIIADQGHDRIQGFRLSEIQRRACLRTLVTSAPQRAVAGKTTTLRAELLGPGGARDWETFRRTGTLSAERDDGTPVALTPSTIELHNGVGTVTLPVDEPGELTIVVSVDGLQASQTVTVLDSPSERVLSGTLTGDDLTWKASDGVIRVDEAVFIGADDTLVIEAGSLVMLGEEARIDIEGDFESNGTDDAPVYVFSVDPDATWAHILHDAPDRTARYVNTFVVGGGNAEWDYWDAEYHRHCCATNIRANHTRLEFVRSVMADSVGKGIMTFYSDVLIRGSVFNRVGLGAELVFGVANVEYSTFATFVGEDDNDALYLSAVDDPGDFHVSHSVFVDAGDDCIDSEEITIYVTDSLFYGCKDKAMSLGSGASEIVNVLAFDSRYGIKYDNAFHSEPATPLVRSSTLLDNTLHGFWASDSSAIGPVKPTFEQVVIWGNGSSPITTEFDPAFVTVSDSNAESFPQGAAVSNSISEQPRFLAPERFDYRLHPTSPGWELDGVTSPIGWRGFGAE
jgi:DNA-binding beta-propeller fold protein YncE